MYILTLPLSLSPSLSFSLFIYISIYLSISCPPEVEDSVLAGDDGNLLDLLGPVVGLEAAEDAAARRLVPGRRPRGAAVQLLRAGPHQERRRRHWLSRVRPELIC